MKQPRVNADRHGLKQAKLTESIIAGFYEVYNELGFAYLESVYERAMELALTERRLIVARQFPLKVHFRGHIVGEFHPDLLVEHAVIVELKAVRSFEPAHEAQLLNYLRASEIEVGLLLNFGPKPEIKRFIFDNARKRLRSRPS